MEIGGMPILFLGSAIFGAGLGYIMMSMFVDPIGTESYSFRHKLKPTWQGITTFIAIAFSASILKVFPEASDAFWSYALGVGAGVFIREVVRQAGR